MIFENFCKNTPSEMFDKVLNAPLVFCGIVIFRITFVGSFFFVLKLQGFVSQMLLQELCHGQVFGSCPNFF